jgi:hypothetical protein
MSGESSAILDATEAARTLERACGNAGSLHVSLVRALARELRRELEATAGPESPGLLEVVEAQQRAADLANLAACAIPEVPDGRLAAQAARRAAGASRALGATAETESLSDPLGPNTRRDLRSAGWKTDFADRQAEEFLARVGSSQ